MRDLYDVEEGEEGFVEMLDGPVPPGATLAWDEATGGWGWHRTVPWARGAAQERRQAVQGALSFRQAAEALRVRRATLAQLERAKLLATVPWGAKRRRIPQDEVERLQREGFPDLSQAKPRAAPRRERRAQLAGVGDRIRAIPLPRPSR